MEIVSGGISGAITDPYSDEAEKHAQLYYEEIRHFSTDIHKIAENTEYSPEQIMLIKNYLFMDEHLLGTEIARFDPCFEIAESWRRLAFDPKNIQPHDLTLLKHELYEMDLIGQGFKQSSAHDVASLAFNYSKESELYYENIKNKEIIKKENQWGKRY